MLGLNNRRTDIKFENEFLKFENEFLGKENNENFLCFICDDRHTNKQTDRQTNKQTNKQRHKFDNQFRRG